LPPSRTRLFAAFALALVATSTSLQRAYAAPLHPTVSLQAGFVGFYPGHLVLDGIGGAFLDDGVLHVHADRIILDMRGERYVAAGTVTVESPNSTPGAAQNVAHGDALGVDVVTHHGVLVDTTSVPTSVAIDGSTIGGAAVIAPSTEPLALPDIGFEQPYARASRAVTHLGADVRLQNARIIVPGGESVGLPSYVYSYSSNPGYSISNINTNGEDLPIYFGSTANSIQGVHFSYNTVTKVAVGLDSHFVGARSYVLVSGSPLIGPRKVFNFTYQDYINDHASQTFNSSTTTGIGTSNAYDLRNSIHRSFLELSAFAQPNFHSSTFAWQSFDQPFGASSGSRPFYHLRSEYGYNHVSQQGTFSPFPPDVALPNTVWHTAFEGYLGSQSFNFGQNASLYGSADLRRETDTLPHRQVSQLYTLTLYTRLTRTISTSFSDSVAPFFDAYPSVDTIYHTRGYQQSLSVNYDHGDPFALSVDVLHASASTDNPSGISVAPWTLFSTLRFRATRSLSLQLSRGYFFGFNGQRFGAFGLQILP
jgi:hypothetical protein